LKLRFEKVYKIGRRTAWIDDNGGGLFRYMGSYLRSWALVDVPRKMEDKFDPSVMTNVDVLARTKYYVQSGDLDAAVRIAQLLRGEPAMVARSWIRDVRFHLETRMLAELLISHATLTNLRTIY